MKLHKNARTCPRSRALMAKRVLHEGESIAEVARQFGVSRHTVKKWMSRSRVTAVATRNIQYF